MLIFEIIVLLNPQIEMRGRAIPKLFFLFCLLVFLVILFLTMLNVEEAEVPGWEFNVSRNLNHYIHREALTATMMPQNFCDNPSLLVIMCISSPSGFEARRAIRKTWGLEKSIMGHNVSIYFLLGQTTDIDVQSKIKNESLEYKDIVQEDFYDTYNNLSVKSAMMLNLFTLKCQSKASYLLKIDDDIYLNLPKLVDDLVTRNRTENLLMGSVICGSKPIRSSSDKWYAGPSYLFPYNIYPSYMSGTSYCMSRDVAKKLLHTALDTPIFHLEDVYLTGICAKKMGLTLTHNGRFTYHPLKPNLCLYKPLITIHYQKPEDIEKIYRSARDSEVEKECQKREEVFIVHKWLMDNVLMVNKTRRKKRCP
ncbi:unnamed protein product [Ceutorhynchus assimilis]|uniref:Hexosyltransferase n=1 Tax=Ceutorhynchus assimilis TaxID=467358 RepID=A0A9N9MCV6_9CUCU|nr:unnamed protein product [Ceutorhynchus assimilis]